MTDTPTDQKTLEAMLASIRHFVSGALADVKIASALPLVANEYDFDNAVGSLTNAHIELGMLADALFSRVHASGELARASTWSAQELTDDCPYEDGKAGQPSGYSIDPGAGSAIDQVQRGWPAPAQIENIKLRGGSVTPLYTIEDAQIAAAAPLASLPLPAPEGKAEPPQCCMCGKTGLSTVEGDGGPECQLADGRWTCSAACYYRATEDLPDLDKLVAFFNEPEAFARWGNHGDHDLLTPAETAIRALRAVLSTPPGSEQGTRLYEVHGYYRTDKIMKVRAETAGEAIEKAKAGDYIDVDTEPGPDIHEPKWTARKLDGAAQTGSRPFKIAPSGQLE